MSIKTKNNFTWRCSLTWRKSAINTLWCLLGCSIGDFGTIFFFQINNINISVIYIMILAIINGLITSILLETFILLKQMNALKAFKTALNMSFISMITMEIVMNITDIFITGGAILNLFVIPIMLFFGFLSAWPYNYWKLKKYNISCH